jgi:ABC-type glycerol-3-phosphate transport system substrate-binding protein
MESSEHNKAESMSTSPHRTLRMHGRHNRRAVVIAMLVLAMTLLLTSCSGIPTVSTEERPIIVLWHSFTGADAQALETLTDRFNTENTWRIVLVTEYQDGMPDQLRSDPERRPDLVTLWPKDLQTYVGLGMVGAVPTMSPDIQKAWGDFLPMAGALYQADGVPQALPLGLATYLSYSNAEWLADLGYDANEANWEAFRRTVCAATNPLRGHVGVGIPARSSLFLAFLAASGSEIVGEDGYYQFADSAGHDAASLLQEIVSGGCGVLYEDRDAGLSRLSKSSMAMIIESSENLMAVERAILSGRNFQLSASPLPGPGGPGATLWYGPGLMITAPDEKRQEAALRVMHWLLSPEAQSHWGAATEYVPMRRSVIETELEEADQATMTASMTRLWQLTLDAADSGAWVAWPQATNRITCRASLLRGLLALQQAETDADAYVDTAVTACNTGVGFRLEPTPAPTETVQP